MDTGDYFEDTITAIATAPGEAGIAIVRLSGSDAITIASKMFSQKGSSLRERKAGTFVHGCVIDADGTHIDEGIALISRSPQSYTSEDVVEFQVHGGSIIAKRVLRRAIELGARLAEPGEFTKRAFLNGKLDLMQAEAVADLIHSQSERASSAALQQLEGKLSAHFDVLFDQLISVAADLEATLDFPEDELPETVMPQVVKDLTSASALFKDMINTWDEGHFLRDGALVVISGKPNVGKSSLLNLLLGKARAIVSNTPGTTRDTIEESLTIQGIPLRIVDTAGLRDTSCDIEQEGIERTLVISEQADLHLYLWDTSVESDTQVYEQLERLPADKSIILLNKMDLPSKLSKRDLQLLEAYTKIETSLIDNESITKILDSLATLLSSRVDLSAPAHAVISERHRSLLNLANTELDETFKLIQASDDSLIIPAISHMRNALDLIGEATGKVYHEELLDQIFSKFCIGK